MSDEWQKLPFKDACERLRRNDPWLTMLDLAFKGLGEAEAHILADSLRNNTVLKGLDLWSNNLGDGGVCALVGVLHTNTALEELHLQCNQCGHKAAIALADTLRTNTTLKYLDLGDHNLGDGGAVALAGMLQANPALKELYVYNCQIGPKGMRSLANSLRTNSTLITLVMYNNNNGGADGVRSLVDSLHTNYTLTRLEYVDGTSWPGRWDRWVDTAAEEVIKRYLQRNQEVSWAPRLHPSFACECHHVLLTLARGLIRLRGQTDEGSDADARLALKMELGSVNACNGSVDPEGLVYIDPAALEQAFEGMKRFEWM